jgi:hypothetical protein
MGHSHNVFGLDVVMLTNNSNKPYFRRVLNAIKREIPVHCSRYVGMKLVDTEYFAFIDSDVKILSGWFEVARR